MSNSKQVAIQEAFLQECSKKRLDIIVGDGQSNKLLSDFVTLAEQLPSAPLPQLAKCCVEIASLRLPIYKHSGQAYIVPRSGIYSVEIGYKGWLVLAQRAGILVRVYPIFKGDDYSFEVQDFEQKFRFKSSLKNIEADKTVEFVNQNLLFIAVLTKSIKTGLVNVELVDFPTLKKLQSKGSGGSAYKDWYLEMLRAKAIKYVLRKIPIDTIDSEIFRAFKADDENEEVIKDEVKKEVSNSSGGFNFNATTKKQDEAINADYDLFTGEIIESEEDDSSYMDFN